MKNLTYLGRYIYYKLFINLSRGNSKIWTLSLLLIVFILTLTSCQFITEESISIQEENKCIDECSELGANGCRDGQALLCGFNYDMDECLEWGETPCVGGCSERGICRDVCIDECEGGKEPKCNNGVAYVCGDYNNDPCFEIKEEPYCQDPPIRCTLQYCPHGNLSVDKPAKVLIVQLKPKDYSMDWWRCCNDDGCFGVGTEGQQYPGAICDYTNPIKEFNNPNPTDEYPSFYSLSDFFTKEGKRYDKDFIVDFETVEPIIVNRLAYGYKVTSEILPTFRKALLSSGVEVSNYDAIIYVYFEDFSGTFPFHSHAYRTEAFVTFSYSIEGVQTILHELLHLYGATDLHDGFGCKIPQSLPNPEQIPLYPQEKACLMCSQIMIDENSSTSPNLLSETIICEDQAQKIELLD